MHVPGVSEFSRGEDVVVFLSRINGEGTFDVYGLMMGKFNVQANSDGTEYIKGPALLNQEPNDHGHSDTNNEKYPTRWSLNALRELIQTQEAEAASRSPTALKKTKTVQTINATSSPPGLQASPSPSLAAPQLQPIEEPGSSGSAFFWVVLIGIIFGVGVFIKKRF